MIKVNDLPILVYDDFYSEQEYNSMWQELLFLKSKMQIQDKDNPLLKMNTGLLILEQQNLLILQKCLMLL